MGFDTYLLVDDQPVFNWRKHAGALPRLLFRFDDLYIETEAATRDAEATVDVQFRTTVAAALNAMELGGLGWRGAVAAYAEVRFSGFSSGMLMAHTQYAHEGVEDASEVAAAVAQFEALPVEEDLRNLGLLMVKEWHDPGRDEVSLLSSLSYGGNLPEPLDAAMAVFESAETRDLPHLFAAVRAAESLAILDRTAPMLVWPLIVCVFLHHLDDQSSVTLVLTEDATVAAGVDDEQSAREYATQYWTDATEYLASEARTLERLFAVLAGSVLAAGPEFWFARCTDLLDRVKLLRSSPDVTTKARGDVLEELMEALVRTEAPELQVVEKNVRTREEELDLVLLNALDDPFWKAFNSPLILVECKNWASKVGVPELRIFESKMQDRGAVCRVGLFVSLGGFTDTFMSRLKKIQEQGGIVFAVGSDDLAGLIRAKRRLSYWLKEEGLRRSVRGSIRP